MMINLIFELSITLDNDHFQKMLSMVYNKSDQLREIEDGYLDLSIASKGITAIFRDSQYKKKIRLLVGPFLVADAPDDTDKLLWKLDKRIAKYFENHYMMDDFTLSGLHLISDIDVGNRKNVAAYMKVLRRIGKVKGFSPASYDNIDEKTSFCLSGNSNDIDFLLYDLESTVMGQLRSSDVGRKKLETASMQTRGILRTEIRLTKPKAIRTVTNAVDTSSQITELAKNGMDVFMDIFAHIIPYGDFYKKDKAMEIICKEVKDNTMRRRMLRLLALIPEKKSLHLAQKAVNCRDIETVMTAFAKINLSPVTISKRHDVKHLENLYSFL